MASGQAIVTVVLFTLSTVTTIRPTKVPLGGNRHFPLTRLTAPVIVIAILWALQCLEAVTILHGIVGTNPASVKPYNILITFFLLVYMSITVGRTNGFRATSYRISNRVSGRKGTRLHSYIPLLATIMTCLFGNDSVILFGTLILAYCADTTRDGSLTGSTCPPTWLAIPHLKRMKDYVERNLPTLYNALPRLPFALVFFAFSQFILVEALSAQGWIDILANWLNIVTAGGMRSTYWFTCIATATLYLICGTSIGGMILLTKIMGAAGISDESKWAACVALAAANSDRVVRLGFEACPILNGDLDYA